MIEKALDTELRDEERAKIVNAAIDTRDSRFIDVLVRLAEDKSAYVRSCAAQGLGKIAKRECFEPLCGLIKDPEELVRQDAILALGKSRDSRALFALANFYSHTSLNLQRHIVHAVEMLHDPRAKEWFNSIKEHADPVIASMAFSAMPQLYAPFFYTFAGTDERRKRSERDLPRVLVKSPENLDAIADIFAEFDRMRRPQTYIVDKDGQLWIGGFVQEHVDVASGQDVLTAGEVIFAKRNRAWKVEYFNNRSNGYYPAKTSYLFFVQAARGAGIDCFDDFSETFPKDGYFSADFLRFQPFFSISSSK